MDVDGSSRLSADSQPKSVGLVWELVATQRSVCIHQMNRVNSHDGFGRGDTTINISMCTSISLVRKCILLWIIIAVDYLV